MGDRAVVCCPHCSQKLAVPSNLGRLDITCPTCNHQFSWSSDPLPVSWPCRAVARPRLPFRILAIPACPVKQRPMGVAGKLHSQTN